MVYGWGLSAILTLILPVLDYTEPFPSDLLPEVDFNTCFLRSMYNLSHIEYKQIIVITLLHSNEFLFFSGESLLIYFYAPLFIIFGINIVCFASTTLKICQIQRDLVKMTSNEESARHQSDLNNGKDE